MKTLKALLLTLFACTAIANEGTSTASSNVSVLTPMAMQVLERQRTIRLYLPPGYQQSETSYPVLYMHDGQNLFDAKTSYAGEWGIDETLNQLAEQGLELIVVGIDNGGEKRMQELSPWTNERFGPAEGEGYMHFIVEQLKPYIDSHYRTLSDAEHTAIMGSSMGGLISHFAIHQYPQVFSKAGIFSPSYWYSDTVFEHTKAHPLPASAKLYLLVGFKEGKDMVQPADAMYQQLLKQQHPTDNLNLKVVKDGEHNEKFWRREFSAAVRWLFR